MMLKLENLSVEVSGEEILRDINLEIEEGETHILFGQNGSGKTSLAMTIMGFPRYRITKGKIIFKGKVINDIPVYERAKLGIGILFQRPPTIRGIKLRQMLEISGHDSADIDGLAEGLNMNDFMDRDINSGFSGGEIKRSEVLQLMAQAPDLSLLDEPDSGVDLESMALMGEAINKLLDKQLRRRRKKAGLIITHTGYILNYVEADKGHVLFNKSIGCSGNPRELIQGISENGYEGCLTCQK